VENFGAAAYTDALGVAGVTVSEQRAMPDEEAHVRFTAWVGASTGYLAGMSEEALRLALEHAQSRRAFGGPLSALEPVQQMLADAATLVDGLSLLAGDSPGLDALVHAGDAAERAVGICMQVTGALGFTTEFPLQRAYRRSRSARAWADAVAAAWDGGRVETPA
jgi:alkylation response protein AidB-like acyl-CoA dehydrogenase